MSDEDAATLPDSTDVAVVGGGVMGTSIAYFLARESDRSVTLLERDGLAAGSTGDSSAILRHHYGDEEIYTDMAWWSHEFFRSFDDEVGARIAYEGSPLVRFADEGTPGGEYARDGYEALSNRDIPVSVHRGEAIVEEYPMYRGASEFDIAVSDDSAAYSDGSDVALGFARGASEHGVDVVTGVAVTEFRTEDGEVTGLRTEAGTVDCDDVVVAAGPWTPRLAETVGVDVPIRPVREQIVLLDPPTDYAETYPSLTPTTSLPDGEWYIRPDFGDGVLVATHRYAEEVDPDDYDDEPDEETMLELVENLEEVIPELADAGIKGTYCGVYSTTPDHDFVIDEAGPEGCYWACGFSGHGFKHAPAVGSLVSGLVRGEEPTLGDVEIDLEYFSLDRFADDPAGNGLPDDYI
ncbi:FAD-dependent oxidoreductase [Halobiforma lacisalsi AJ5]|uniref:FAD-dependent oxidoreductase n=1 Tax=Natronobacterium lacisalsi AJ5 TaxID=358396 RepID=M0LYU9_NATLA|nr:FAD-binding oxidoreductase [Halobiforma lacisalsi]APW97757.1 FAD-dependent oxidoreductase [Halobiforma lacisalsi AJ5]EMA37499.1 FAD dependent oxidoreductase [Halobiforma lacisalsi AJ5]